ncbi:DUF159 domain protein [Thozetella sp. PMI_491]|nr:DUF159 domain protein [Thozetella sp. PMI_491]
MCGRYSLALRMSQVRRLLEQDDMVVDEAPEDEAEGSPRQTHNFAPGYNGIVYRADVPDWGAGPRRQDAARSNDNDTLQEEAAAAQASSQATTQGDTHYKLQSMKWGLIPFWTKRNPDYASMLKTINCRDDSLATPGGMWASMKGRKRCIVIAQGFYEWLKPQGSKEKIPHYIKRKDGKLLCMAGLWDCVQYEDEQEGRKSYTYTIITTDSNAQLKFLHDRMPVILEPASEAMQTWLDPARHEWSSELQRLLKPYTGELEVYAVSKEVGKVGNNSPNFIIPVASKENKSNIANFFAKGAKKNEMKHMDAKVEAKTEVKIEGGEDAAVQAEDGGRVETPVGIKRQATTSPAQEPPPVKKLATPSPSKPSVMEKQAARKPISATRNAAKSPAKKKVTEAGSQKITKFFGGSA